MTKETEDLIIRILPFRKQYADNEELYQLMTDVIECLKNVKDEKPMKEPEEYTTNIPPAAEEYVRKLFAAGVKTIHVTLENGKRKYW